jgi:hypothetical protein
MKDSLILGVVVPGEASETMVELCLWALTLTAHGLEELFSSCGVVSVFGSGGK